jgi:hypothetical protein
VPEPLPDIYQRDPDPRPDSDFEAGALAHLVPGNAGRMLDPRRTPVRVGALRPEIGSWVCEVTAFEDRGARWNLPFESIAHYQFEHGAARATAEALQTFEERVRHFAVPLNVAPDPERARATRAALERRRADAAAWLEERAPALRRVADIDHAARRAPIATVAVFETFMMERGLLEMDHVFARTYVSNPASGETVKGHLIVMAEMGIAPYRGTIVRDRAAFVDEWRRPRRADHILWRTAFVQAMFAALRLETLELHRGVSSDTGIEPTHGDVLESWSFSRDVAEGVAGPPEARAHRVIHTRGVSHRRAFMTYLETRAMNRQFLEAEAVLFAEGSGIEG